VLRNVRVVQAFTREPEAGARFSGRSRGAVRAALAAMDLEARWSPVADLLLAVTDADGRVPDLHAAGALVAGVHRLTFATGEWFQAQGIAGFYPQVTVVCRIDDPSDHYHVPLLLSPYGYSTYRGS